MVLLRTIVFFFNLSNVVDFEWAICGEMPFATRESAKWFLYKIAIM